MGVAIRHNKLRNNRLGLSLDVFYRRLDYQWLQTYRDLFYKVYEDRPDQS